MVQLRPSVALAGQAVLLISLAAGATAVHVGHAQAQPPTTTKPVAPAATTVPAAVPRCDRSQLRGRTARYEGRSVSATYDKVFRPWAWVPFLKTHVPQALTTWSNWDGVGHNLVLLGMYRRGHHSLLVGFDPASGRPMGTVEINQSHLGGMGFVGRWLFAQDNADADSHATVRRYRIDQLRAAMRKATRGGHDRPFLRMDGKPRRIDAIDFFAEEGNSVYAGNHGSERTARMYRYTLSADGHLQRAEGPWRIPPRAQGLVITPRLFIFSTSHGTGRGRLELVRRGAPSAAARPFACVWIPAMPEDMTVVGRNVLIDFESGTAQYAPLHPSNRIKHFHAGGLDALLTMTHGQDPTPPRPAPGLLPPIGPVGAPPRSAAARL